LAVFSRTPAAVEAVNRGLFDNTTPPPAEHETRHFPAPTTVADKGAAATAEGLKPGYQATDEDLPGLFFEEPKTPPQPVTAPKPEAKPVPQAVPAPIAPPATPAPTPAPTGEVAAPPKQREEFLKRVMKIYHDLVTSKTYTGQSTIMQTYVLRDTGYPRIVLVPVSVWEKKLAAIEGLKDHAAILAIVKGEAQ
jgi:hypothetical protein